MGVFGFLAQSGIIDDGVQDVHGTCLTICLFILIVTTSLTQRSAVAGKDSTPQLLLELMLFVPLLAGGQSRTSTRPTLSLRHGY